VAGYQGLKYSANGDPMKITHGTAGKVSTRAAREDRRLDRLDASDSAR
jgi:hypothetical protein